MKRLTVVIPGYKTPESDWRRCLRSVLSSVGEGDEIICVDDGSPVRPLFLNDLASQDSRIKVIYLEHNHGQGHARNVALDEVSSKYVTFVDSDDEVVSGVYDTSLKMAENENLDIVFFGLRTIWTNDGLYLDDIPPRKAYGLLGPEGWREIVNKRFSHYPWNKIYKVDFITRNGYPWNKPLRFDPDGMPCEDIMFNLSCVIRGSRWGSIDKIGYIYYRNHASSLSRYKRTGHHGVLQASEMWKDYKKACNGAGVFGSFGECSEADIAWMDWDNMWMKGSPIALRDRYRWLVSNRGLLLGGGSSLKRKILSQSSTAFFLYELCYRFMRGRFYIRPIRRWHIRSLYPAVRNWDYCKC